MRGARPDPDAGLTFRPRTTPASTRISRVISIVRIACGLLAALGVLGTNNHARAQRLTFRQYAQERGLSNLGIQCLDQDRDGFVLVCTEDGAFRYDGRHFDPLGQDAGLPDHGIVYALERTADGGLFVVFSDAVYVLRPGQPDGTGRGRFVAARSADGPIEVVSPHRAVLLDDALLLVERDRLSIVRDAAGSGPVLTPFFSKAVLAAHPQLRRIVSIGRAPDGIWLGCGTGELCHVSTSAGPDDTGAVTVLDAAAGLPSCDWAAFLQDRSGTLWVRSLDWIAHRPAGATRFVVDPVAGGPGRYAGHMDRLVLAQDEAGRILTQGPHGLLVWQNGTWSGLDVAHGLPEGEIVSIMFDRERSMWLGIRSQGVFRGIGLGEWENWTRNDGLGDNVAWQMSRAGTGPLWVATEGGVDALPQTIPSGRTGPHLPGSSYALATSRDGRVWHATLDGSLGRLDPATGQDVPVAALPPVYEMAIDRAGRLWIGTKAGLYRLNDADAFQPGPPVRVPGVDAWIRDIAEAADGTLWLISSQALLHLDAGSVVHPVMTTATGLLPSLRTLAFATDGTLWLGSGIDGIQRLHLEDDRIARIEPITTPTMSSNTILTIRRDHRGWMWIANDRGLDVWNGAAWHHLDEDDGLLSDDVNEGSLFEDPDGSMWVGTGHGISHLLDPAPIFTSLPLHPVITRALLGGEPLPAGPVAWSRAPLVIRFSTVDYRDERSVRFRYRLDGVDRDWVDTDGNEVRYPQLPPGTLVFSVMAFDPLKRRTSAPVSFQITVTPPWWGSRLVQAAFGLILSALLVSLWRLRVRYLLRRQHQLEGLVALRTAEIERARASLFTQATRDDLTGLLNRSAIMQAFDAALADARRDNTPLAVALLDLDHFKTINDRFGHLGGDALLRGISGRLIGALHPSEHAGRYGGEELLLLLPGERHPGGRIHLLRDAMVGAPFTIDGTSVVITCSIGVTWQRAGDTPEMLLRRADTLLYAAKNDGRDRVAVDMIP